MLFIQCSALYITHTLVFFWSSLKQVQVRAIMHIAFSSSIALVLPALFYSPTFALFGLDRRLVCVQDDVYDGFHNAPAEDANPYCSSRLGIQDILSTRIGYTSRTYVDY